MLGLSSTYPGVSKEMDGTQEKPVSHVVFGGREITFTRKFLIPNHSSEMFDYIINNFPNFLHKGPSIYKLSLFDNSNNGQVLQKHKYIDELPEGIDAIFKYWQPTNHAADCADPL